ncbi:MAG: HAD family hydrolase, partial [Pseudomonadota bacterium]
MRIAMWSGPRNLSTAMMRSFSARGDTVCVDEPFYAAYLALTGLEHPMRAEILAAQPTDPHEVARAMSADKTSQPIVYQKQMTHHMV